tara:strand:+ start:40 stop:4134 length:4095 start_codon:yes stop_codon:yes gene_type:complete
MTDSNLQNTVPEGAFGIGSKKTDDFTKNEELRNTGIQDIPNMLINALTKQSGGIVMPSQITEQTVTNFQEGVENVPLLRKEDEQTVRAGLAAGFDLTENAINFAGRAIGGLSGNKYTAKDFFDNEKLGVYIPEEDENSLSYNLTKLGVQYGIPYTAAFKFLGSIGLSNFVWKDVLAGGTTASVFFDTFDKNLSNYLVDTPLVGPVAKLLAAESEEESNVAKETIKKFIEGGVTAKIANKTFDAVLNPQKVSDAFINVVDFFKKSPQATKRLIFNLQQSKFNKFSNLRKFNSMDEVLRVSDDLVDVAPVTDEVITKTDDILITPRKKIRSQKGKQKFQTTDTPVGFEGRNMNLFSDDPKEVAKIKAAYEQELNEYYPKYKNIVTDDMLIEDADDFLEQEVIQELKEFSDKYGFKLPVLMAASVRRISGLAENLSDGAKLLKTLPTGSEEAKILKSKLAIQTVNFYRLITGDSRAGTVVGRALYARQLANAPNPVTGKTPGQVTESNIQVKRAEEVKGGGSEVIRDIAKDIDDTFQNLGFTQDDLLKALEEDNFEGFADFASKLAAAHGDPFVLQKFVKESFAGKLLKISNEQFINGILSNPATHARNTIGTMINVIKGPADLLAGSISREGLDPILFRRAMAEFAMFKQAQSDALKLAGQAFKDERNILDKSRMIVDSGNDPTQRFAIATQGGTYDGDGLQKVKSGEMSMAQYIKKGLVPDLYNAFGTAIRSPTRALLAEDEYNKQLSFRMFLKGSLVEDGLRRGLDGKALDDYVDTSFELGTSWIAKKGEELDLALKGISESKAFIGSDGEAVAIGEDLFLKIRDALDYAADRTFTTRIDNKFVNAFKHPGWKPLIPFINTPLNLQQTLLKNTPMATKLTNNPLLKGMLDTHRKQLQSADPSVAARARGVTRVGGGIWATAIGLSIAASDKFAKIALVDGNDPDWKEDKLRKYAGDIGYALRFLITDPLTKEPELGPDGQPKYYFFDVGRIGLDPVSSIFRAAGWWGTYSKYLSDDDQKNAALVMSTALARDILNIPMLENIQTLFDIIENRPDALPNFIANYGNSALIPFVSARRGLSKREYTIIDPRSGKKLKGFFKHDKSIQKGDYIKEEVRTTFDDGTPIPEDHPAYGTLKRQKEKFPFEFFTKKVVLKMFKEIEASNPFKTDIQPERHWLTHQFLEYPKNLGPNSGLNPTYHGTSMNDPVISLMRRSRSKISKPLAHLFRKSPEGGILLDSTQYRTFTDLIGSIKLDDNGIESEKGKTVYERLYPLATNKNILKLLDFIDEGEVDEDFTIDTTALLTDRINTSRDLRSVLNKVIKPYIGTAKLKLFQLEDDQGGAKSLLPAYLKEKRRQELQIQNRNLR